MNTIITPTVDLEKEVLMQIKQHSPREGLQNKLGTDDTSDNYFSFSLR